MPGFEPNPFGEMCNREYQEAGGDKYKADDPETNSAYGATAGQLQLHPHHRPARSTRPDRTRPAADLAAAVENLGALDGRRRPAELRAGQVHVAERPVQAALALPVPAGQEAVRRHVHPPRKRSVPVPELIRLR